jgi:putative hydrolase
VTDQPFDNSNDEAPEALLAILRQIFGDQAEEALAQLRASGLDLSILQGLSSVEVELGQVEAMAARMRAMMDASGDSAINWELAHTVARQEAVKGGDPAILAATQRSISETFDLAELWLSPVTDFDSTTNMVYAWSRSEWVEATLPVLTALFEPVARRVADALVMTMTDELPDPADFAASEYGLPFPMASELDPVALVRQMGGAVFGMQVGQAAGTLSREVFGCTDLGLPLVSARAMLPRNVAEYAAGLNSPDSEVRLFLALREAAHARLFAHVPWLKSHLVGAVERFAREITVDMSAMHEAITGINFTDPEALRSALASGVFHPQHTEAQQAALLQLETALALVEGWVDHVSGEAAARHLPNAVALAEMMRRRRAAGGPAEQTFTALVGLELRPRRAREASRLWARLTEERGISGRDGIWAHPDLMPTAADLDDPDGFGQPTDDELSADLDAALADILGADDEPDDDAPGA